MIVIRLVLGVLILVPLNCYAIDKEESAVNSPETLKFTVEGIDGSNIQSSNLDQKLIYLDFWASWCGPCKRSLSFMSELHNKFSGTQLEIVAVSVDEKKEDALKMISPMHLPFFIGFDPQGKLIEKFSPKAMPTSYLIKKSKIIESFSGFREGDEIKILQKISQELSAK